MWLRKEEYERAAHIYPGKVCVKLIIWVDWNNPHKHQMFLIAIYLPLKKKYPASGWLYFIVVWGKYSLRHDKCKRMTNILIYLLCNTDKKCMWFIFTYLNKSIIFKWDGVTGDFCEWWLIYIIKKHSSNKDWKKSPKKYENENRALTENVVVSKN